MRTRVRTPINLSYCSKRLGESRTGIIERIEPNIKDRIYSSFVIRGSYKLIKVNVEKERKRKNRKKTTPPNTKPRLRSVLITRSVVEETMQMKILCSDDPASPFLPPPSPSLSLLFQVELNPKHFIRVVLARLTIHYTLVNSVQEVSATASAKNLIGHRYSSHQISFTFITGDGSCSSTHTRYITLQHGHVYNMDTHTHTHRDACIRATCINQRRCLASHSCLFLVRGRPTSAIHALRREY